jgi:maltodextrin utilization protein YvdJ
MEKKIRFALMVFLTFVLVAPVAAASNQQKIFSLDSDVHQAIEFLIYGTRVGSAINDWTV